MLCPTCMRSGYGASQPRQGGADGREVWVVESPHDGITGYAKTREGAERARAAKNETITKYVPAESSQQQESGWVPCSGRMPDDSGDEVVLIYFETTEQLLGAWDGDDWLVGDRIVPRRHVTHWMPLPPPPASEGQ